MNLINIITLWLTADDKTRKAVEAILRGVAHARRYPEKKVKDE